MCTLARKRTQDGQHWRNLAGDDPKNQWLFEKMLIDIDYSLFEEKQVT